MVAVSEVIVEVEAAFEAADSDRPCAECGGNVGKAETECVAGVS